MALRLERCPRCGPAWFHAHPSGWRCSECNLCVDEFQTTLTEYWHVDDTD